MGKIKRYLKAPKMVNNEFRGHSVQDRIGKESLKRRDFEENIR